MVGFAKIQLSNNTKVGEGIPASIQHLLVEGWAGLAKLADPSQVLDPVPEGIAGFGWWPIIDITITPHGKTRSSVYRDTVHVPTKTVQRVYSCSHYTPKPIELPARKYKSMLKRRASALVAAGKDTEAILLLSTIKE